MARFADWQNISSTSMETGKEYLYLSIMPVSWIVTSVISAYFPAIALYLAFIGMFLFAIPILLKDKMPIFSLISFPIGGGIIFGFMLFQYSNSIFLTNLVMVISFGLLYGVFLYARREEKTKDLMHIFLDNKLTYNTQRELISGMRSVYRKEKGKFTRYYGPLFQGQYENDERISARIIKKKEDNRYEIYLMTNKAVKSTRFLSIQKNISKMVKDMDKRGLFDIVPGEERFICKKCGNDTEYMFEKDEFHCPECKGYKAEDEVDIEAQIKQASKL